MTTFADELTIIRRFLRDPDGNIWSDLDILTFWNDAQQEIFSKVGYLERAHSYKYPPEWTWSYMRDWEYQHTEGDKYQCLTTWQARNAIVCYPWEAGYFLTNSGTADDGSRFTHPWESEYCTPADYVPLPLHADFHNMKFCAYDEEYLEPIDRKQLSLMDRNYRTSSGSPEYYWRPDKVTNQFVMYRRPSSMTWDDINLLRSPLDSFDDAGGIKTWAEADLDEKAEGVITDTIATDGKVFMVFEAMPGDISESPGDWYQELSIPDWMSKYLRYGTLERCYGANTDGFIPSLRDYWRLRKEIGLKAIKKYKSLRRTDRDYRLGGGIQRSAKPTGRLPSTYPTTYP